MALVVKDRVKETTTSTGTGTITLAGAAGGFQSFSAIGDGNTTYYALVDSATGDWEVGLGTYTASGTTLSRDTVLESSNSGSLVNFASGIKSVFCTHPAERSITTDASGNITVTGNIVVNGTVDGRDVATDGTKLDGIEANAKDDQTITAGSGLSGGGTGDVTLSHADTSSQASVNNSGNTFIQDVTLDTYGHVTGLTSSSLTLGALASLDAVGAAQITDNTVGAAELNVTGNGTTSQFLRSDGDGTFTWATPTDTNTTYSAGSGLSLSGTTFTNSAPDQTVTLTGSGATSVSGTYPNFTISSTDTNTDTNTTYTASTGLTLTGTAFSVDYGTASGTACQGNDSRLSNSRTCNNSFDNASTARSNLGLGSLATLSTVNAATITDNSVGAAELNVSGNGSTSQFLRSDGDGSFTWATPTDTNTTYSAGTNLSLSGTTFNVSSSPTFTQATFGSGVVLKESTDRADLLSVTSSTSGWGGLQVANSSGEAIMSLMVDGNTHGLYDDLNSDWVYQWDENGESRIYYNGAEKFNTHASGCTVTGNLTVTGSISGAGKVLQVQSNTWNTISATSSTSFSTIGSVTITPSSTSSKIFVLVNAVIGASGAISTGQRLLRGSTLIFGGASVSGATQSAGPSAYGGSGDGNNNEMVSISGLDSPNTTSAVTYNFQWRSPQGGTIRINDLGSGQRNTSYSQTSASTITVFEIAG
jgi:hypothetical protein